MTSAVDRDERDVIAIQDDRGPVRSVARAADILLALQDGPQSLGRIAHRTGLSKPTAHRLLASLAYRQMVIQDPDTVEYLLGPGCLRIADGIMRGAVGIRAVVMPVLEQLAASTGETIALHVRAGFERICIGQAVSPQPVRYTAHVGGTYPLHVGSMGKVLIAFSDPADRAELLERLPLTALTAVTVTDRSRLAAEIEQIRAHGSSVSRGERQLGVAAMSAPILGPDGRLIAALSVLGPDGRLSDAAFNRIRPELLAAAEACGGRLGGSGERVDGAVGAAVTGAA